MSSEFRNLLPTSQPPTSLLTFLPTTDNSPLTNLSHEQNLFAKIAYLLAGVLLLYPLMAIFSFEFIMFTTIFELGIKNPGVYTKKRTSYIIMPITGGAVVPVVMGSLAQSAQFSYTAPLICLVFVFFLLCMGIK